MAGESAFSCDSGKLFRHFSSFRPSSAQRLTTAESINPASPRTSICREGRPDSSIAAEQVDRGALPDFPFITGAVGKETSLREIDPASFVIERLDEGWFTDNVIRCQWWNICNFSWGRRTGPRTGEAMRWDLRRHSESERFTNNVIRCQWWDIGNFFWGPPPGPRTGEVMLWDPRSHSESELLLAEPASGIRTSDSNLAKSASQPPPKIIEMVQPLAGTGTTKSLSADRDSRGLPGSRLRKLPKVFPADELSISDGEQKRYLRLFRTQSEDVPDALRRLGDKRVESSKTQTSLRRRRERHVPEAVAETRRFSDGEEPGEDASAPLRKVSEEVGFQPVENSSSRASSNKSSSNKIRNSAKLEQPTNKPVAGSSEKERRSPRLVGNSSMPAPPARRRRRDRKKSSRSLSELEYDELRGCIDLGFNFNPDELTPRVISVFPGLKFYKGGDDWLGSPNKLSPKSRIHSPRGWTRQPDSLLKWRIPSSQDSTVDMKSHLKFWAHSVASTVSAEC